VQVAIDGKMVMVVVVGGNEYSAPEAFDLPLNTKAVFLFNVCVAVFMFFSFKRIVFVIYPTI
jgi:hypothetical protein